MFIILIFVIIFSYGNIHFIPFCFNKIFFERFLNIGLQTLTQAMEILLKQKYPYLKLP